ncbi:hypothetical protein RVW00_004124 [Enterobacter bugandensis]|nr:hypothetical protein [Enterobacter bugandensis]
MKEQKPDNRNVLERAFSITELAEITGRDRKAIAAAVRPLTPTPDSSRTRKYYTVRTLLQALSNPQDLDVSRMTPA